MSLSAAAAGDALAFVPDPLAAALARGERPPQFGLACNVNYPPAAHFRGPHERWVAGARCALGAAAADFYWYPFEHLHVTVATLVTFTATRFGTESERGAVTAAWLEWAARVLAPALPTRPITLTARRVAVSPAAVFLMYDESPELTALRAVIDGARQDAALVAAGAFDGGAGFKIPGIVHTTVARPIAAPGDSAATTDALRACGEAWAPLEVVCDALYVVLENRPYMHVGAGTMLWSGGFGSGSSGDGGK